MDSICSRVNIGGISINKPWGHVGSPEGNITMSYVAPYPLPTYNSGNTTRTVVDSLAPYTALQDLRMSALNPTVIATSQIWSASRYHNRKEELPSLRSPSLTGPGRISTVASKFQNASISDVEWLRKSGSRHLQVWTCYKWSKSGTRCTVIATLRAVIRRSSSHMVREPPRRIHH